MKKPILTLFLSACLLLAKSQTFSLIKDINPGANGSNISFLTNVDNTLFFAANNSTNGMELWKSDGSSAGTVLVKDINPGASSSSIGYLTTVNHTLFFVANNGSSGTELWKSDGTASGTVMVKDIRAGSLGSNPSWLAELNGMVFFAANNGINGTELWKSDGTAAGTVMVKDIHASGSSYPQSFVNVNGQLFFTASNGTLGMELWKTDGSSAGTVLVKDIWTGSGDGFPYELTRMGSSIFFSANDPVNGTELWKSDGTAAGTILLKDIWPGAGESYPFSLREIGGTLFFSADNGSTGIELWKSDGTAAGTVLVKDVWPGMESGAVGNFSKMINRLIFTGNDGVSGNKTWQSDGSTNGTMEATSLVVSGTMQDLEETQTNIFASIQSTGNGLELWGLEYSAVLPVELLDLNGRLLNRDAVLEWKTISETKSREFIIERSIDGTNFQEAGRINARNGHGVQQYDFTDAQITTLGAEKVFYRIRQDDILGRVTYSRVILLQIMQQADWRLYPVPAKNELNLSASFRQKDKIDYHIIDQSGRIVMSGNREVISGVNNFSIPVSGLAAGAYYLQLKGAFLHSVLRFSKD